MGAEKAYAALTERRHHGADGVQVELQRAIHPDEGGSGVGE